MVFEVGDSVAYEQVHANTNMVNLRPYYQLGPKGGVCFESTSAGQSEP